MAELQQIHKDSNDPPLLGMLYTLLYIFKLSIPIFYLGIVPITVQYHV